MLIDQSFLVAQSNTQILDPSRHPYCHETAQAPSDQGWILAVRRGDQVTAGDRADHREEPVAAEVDERGRVEYEKLPRGMAETSTLTARQGVSF